MTTFYIFRHGETEAKKANPPLVSGRLDTPLTAEGRRQISEKIGPIVRSIRIDKAFLSPLARSRQSFEAAYEGFDGSIPSTEVIPQLREIDYGDFDGKPIPEFNATKKAWQESGKALDFNTKLGGAESNAEAADRFESALLQLARENPGKNLLLPSHNGIMRALFFLGKVSGGDSVMEPGKDLPFGAVVVLESDGTSLAFSKLV